MTVPVAADTSGSDARSAHIEFRCKEKWYDQIPHPQPASKVLPHWYRDLPFETDHGRTARACMGFLDALTMGWIIPMPFDLEVEVDRDGRWDMQSPNPEFPLFKEHRFDQLNGYDHPQVPCPLFQIMTPWTADTPEGVSCLLTPLMNRHEPRFRPFSGVVDTDGYRGALNFPSIWTEIPYSGVVEAGTPVGHVIPFRRDGLVADGLVTADESNADLPHYETGEYRNEVWAPKPQARIITEPR